MRHENLGVFLEFRRHHDKREVALLAEETAEQVSALEEVDLAGEQEQAAVSLWTARLDRDVEAIFGVGAVDDGLVEAARTPGVASQFRPNVILSSARAGPAEATSAASPASKATRIDGSSSCAARSSSTPATETFATPKLFPVGLG